MVFFFFQPCDCKCLLVDRRFSRLSLYMSTWIHHVYWSSCYKTIWIKSAFSFWLLILLFVYKEIFRRKTSFYIGSRHVARTWSPWWVSFGCRKWCRWPSFPSSPSSCFPFWASRPQRTSAGTTSRYLTDGSTPHVSVLQLYCTNSSQIIHFTIHLFFI